MKRWCQQKVVDLGHVVTEADRLVFDAETRTLRMELHEMLCSECPFCSDMIIRTIALPLVGGAKGVDGAPDDDVEALRIG